MVRAQPWHVFCLKAGERRLTQRSDQECEAVALIFR